MRMYTRLHATALALCLSLAAGAALAGAGPQTPPAPSAPPPPPEATTAVPTPPNVDRAALQADMKAAHEAELRARMDAGRQAALQERMEAARRRMEVDAQQLAALSAQMAGPMMQRYTMLVPHALIGVQLGGASGPAGARVGEVSPGGPADQAGVRAGDLITAVNGTDVRGTDPTKRVFELLQGIKPGEKVDLRVLRDGKTRDFAVTARPTMVQIFDGGPVQLPAIPVPPVPPVKALTAWAGAPMIIRGPVADMELARLTPGLGRYFGSDKGVLVVHAPPDGALGLQDGDVILSIGGRTPIDSSHVIRILGSYDPGEKITLEVLRQHRKISVVTTLPAMSRRMLLIPGGGMQGPGAVIALRDHDRPL